MDYIVDVAYGFGFVVSSTSGPVRHCIVEFGLEFLEDLRMFGEEVDDAC